MPSIKELNHLKISLDAIKSATNNFNEKNYINEGGFGKVYKGELVRRGKSVRVAVKRLEHRTHGQGTPEFWKEIMMLSQYRHTNLVSLLGFCDEGSEKILVYEYMSNKSLDMYLSDNHLSWVQRLKICIGAARGLEYLHNPKRTMQRVLHRDIKSSNILLDEKWNAKISDFGLSKLGPANQKHTFLFSNPTGTLGYIDPLYIESGYLTKESDVYSFGVVLFEVLCGRSGFMNYNDSRRLLGKLAQNCYEQKKICTIVPDFLMEQILPKCLYTYANIAYQCLRKKRNERPSATYIIKQLQNALKYQCNVPSAILEYPLLHEDEPNLKNARAPARTPARTQATFGAYSFRPQKYTATCEKEVLEATEIQRPYRCHRRPQKYFDTHVKEDIAAIKIQRAYRGHRKERAATLIQCFFRRWKARNDYKKTRQEFTLALCFS